MKKARTIVLCAVLSAALAVLSLTGCAATTSPQSAEGKQTTSFGLGYLNSTSHVLAFVAQEEGFFAEEGLDVTLTQFSSGTELVSALESTKLDAAFIGSYPAIAQQANGHGISIFGGAMTNGHGYIIKSEYTQGLDSWDVTILKGKNVAVPRTTTQELELKQILDHYGLTYAEDGSADVQLTYFDSQKDAYTALSNNEIDAASCYSPYTALGVEAGYSIVYRCSDEAIFDNQPCCRQVALTEAIEKNPETYTAFERALIKAYDFYKTNPEQSIVDVQQYIDIEPELIEFELYEGYSDSNPDPDKKAVVAFKDQAVAGGQVAEFDIDPLIDTDIYKTALDELLAEQPDNARYRALSEHFAQSE